MTNIDPQRAKRRGIAIGVIATVLVLGVGAGLLKIGAPFQTLLPYFFATASLANSPRD